MVSQVSVPRDYLELLASQAIRPWYLISYKLGDGVLWFALGPYEATLPLVCGLLPLYGACDMEIEAFRKDSGGPGRLREFPLLTGRFFPQPLTHEGRLHANRTKNAVCE